jgi:hypothetical protein
MVKIIRIMYNVGIDEEQIADIIGKRRKDLY